MSPPRRKKDALAEDLARLAGLRSGPLAAEDLAYLKATLARGVSFAAARAARVVRERALEGFEPELVACWKRFLDNPVKTDPGCEAKLAALEALDASGTYDAEPFEVAARYVQKEPSYGPPVDTATGVRARAIRALANMGYRDLALVAGELLADESPPVRQAAAEAVAHAGDRGGAGLLLLAAIRGDEDPVVQTAYWSGLLELALDHVLPRLRKLLLGPDADARELAAIALGNSGKAEAAELLVEAMEATPLAAERALSIRALGLHRSDRALAVLIGLIADGPPGDAAEAVRALAPRRFETKARERIEAAVRARASPALDAVLREAFTADE